MHWKTRIKHAIPPKVLNEFLLMFPFLYGTPLVNYETNLIEHHGIEELLDQLEHVEGIPGDIIECGSSRCGATVIMARHLERRGVPGRIYACDSFEGFNPDELRREKQAGLANAPDDAFRSTSLDYVRRKLQKLGVANRIELVQGYFQDTLPGLGGTFSFALIDCDLMESMRFAADTVWPRIATGGRLVFDDYRADDFAGARRAIDAFVDAQRHDIACHGFLKRLYFVEKAAPGE